MHNRLYCDIPHHPIEDGGMGVCKMACDIIPANLSNYKLSDLNEVTDVIRSKELMNIQSAGNQGYMRIPSRILRD